MTRQVMGGGTSLPLSHQKREEPVIGTSFDSETSLSLFGPNSLPSSHEGRQQQLRSMSESCMLRQCCSVAVALSVISSHCLRLHFLMIGMSFSAKASAATVD